jgi:hypothetical protein
MAGLLIGSSRLTLAHKVSEDEQMPERRQLQIQVPAGTEDDFARLLEVADRGPEGVRIVRSIVRLVADEVESMGARAELPDEEREEWEAAGAVFDRKATARSRSRRIGAYVDLIGRSLQGDAAVARLLGVDRTRISQRLAEHSLYAFANGDDRMYPRWQFDGGKALRGLKTVLGAMDATVHPLVVDHWFRTPNVDLVVDDEPMSPLEWLRSGGDPGRAAELVPDT